MFEEYKPEFTFLLILFAFFMGIFKEQPVFQGLT